MWRQTHELFSCTETTLNNQYLKCILPRLFLSTLELELYTCNAAYYHNYAIHRHSGHVLGLFVNVFDMIIVDLMLSFTT